MRIGVIVPVREPAPFLDEAVGSALAQEPPPDAHVVVHDHAGRGPAAARDEGLARLAEGGERPVGGSRLAGGGAGPGEDPRRSGGCDWIALLDADDAWEPGKLAAQREAVERWPDADVCFGRAVVVGADGQPTGERLPEMAPGLHRPADLARVLFESNPIVTSSVLVRREALEAAGGFAGPAPLAEDWDLWLRLVARGASFVSEPRARVRYRRHDGGLTADVAALAESMLRVHAAHGHLVDEDTRRRTESRDRLLLARGRIRQRRWEEAAAALRAADRLEPLRGRERALLRAVALPGVRAALGRRRPYR